MTRPAKKGLIYANLSARVWHRNSIQLHVFLKVFFLLSCDVTWLICRSSGSHLWSAISKRRWLCWVSLCQKWILPLQPKERQARQAGKPGDKFSSQIKQLAGFQFSSLHLNSLCICKTPGCVKHPHRTNKYDIRFMSCGTLEGSVKVSLPAQEPTRSF